MKAILIDPKNCAVTEVEYTGTLENLYEHLGCDMVQTAPHPISHHTLYVDEEGLYKKGNLAFEFGPDIYVGRGLLIGPVDPNGKDTGAKVSAEYVRTLVKFPKIMVRG